MRALAAPARRPGRRRPRRTSPHGEGGAVVVEAAVALVALVAVVGALTWLLVLVGAQLRVADAARAGARAAARGDSTAHVVTAVHQVAPGTSVEVARGSTSVTVAVRDLVRPPGPLAGIGTVQLSGRAVAEQEHA